MLAKGIDRFVGRAFISLPKGSHNALAISYGVMPAHEGRGYATAAVQLLSEIVLTKGIADFVCAETAIDNQASARVLVKAGFRETAQGLCSTGNESHGVVRRFLRGREPLDSWPISTPDP